MGLDITKAIKERVLELEEETIAIRGHLHEYPEVGGEEPETAKFLKAHAQKLGLEIEEVEGTGFTALLDTGKPGKTVGLRTDIDALPVEETEDNLAGPRKFISKNPGVMHACGHDGHMAIVLSTMTILSEMKDELTGKIYFIFEEAEEFGGGIDAMIKHLTGKGIDAIYGTHLTAFMDTGTISVDAGPVMAAAAIVDFSVVGRGGHGSRPDLSINPLFASAQVLSGLTNAWANRVDVTKTVTLGLTKIKGGEVLNVIPNDVRIGGTLRYFDVEEGEKAVETIRTVIHNTAKAHECTIVEHDISAAGLPVSNDEEVAKIAQDGIREILPDALVSDVTWFASESFGRYAEIAPTAFAFVGIRDEEYGSGAEHHNHLFDLDDAALKYGVAATTKFAVDYLTK